MSILQENKELRYIRRQNLQEEARVVGNYFRDLIRSYGVDVRYYKLQVPFPETFTDVVNQNSLLLHAYGYEDHPTWKISCEMISYMEVENDIFNLNKFGMMPTTDVTFYFDSLDFATSLAPKLGKMHEFKVTHDSWVETVDSVFDLEKLKIKREFKSDLLSGTVEFDLSNVECNLMERVTVPGKVIFKTKPHALFPANEDLYKSFNYRLTDDDCEDLEIKLTFYVTQKHTQGFDIYCEMDGAILFHDLTMVGKYANEITPQVGDIVTIDFPDEQSREQYEITSCTDKQLTTDGLNPLLHRYIWKCKAKRFVAAEEGFPETNLANEQVSEKFDLESFSMEKVTEKISKYDKNQDMVYGGYQRTAKFKDINRVEVDLDDDGSLMNITDFRDGSGIITDGFDLYFRTSAGKFVKITARLDDQPVPGFSGDLDVQFLKVAGDSLYFTRIDGTTYKVYGTKVDESVDDLMDPDKKNPFGWTDNSLTTTQGTTVFNSQTDSFNPNSEQPQSFFKFPNSDIYLVSTGENLLLKRNKDNLVVVLA